MTDKEIIKALDGADVFLRNRANSEPAQLNEYDIEAFIDIANVCDEAANLINRQNAKIKASQMDNKQLETDNLNANMNCEHLQAEIERLKAEADMADGYEDAICERARTEAKKEFAEELIYKIVNSPTKFESTYYMYREGIAIRQNEIIDIIKEKVGEN